MGTSALQSGQLRVRMYRVGFGDCFLVSLPVGEAHRHVLIDCGVHSQGDIKTLPQVIEDIRTETNDHLGLLVVTHAHQDHVSGFGTYAQKWAQVTLDEIWMPWTESPTDPQALALRSKQLSLARQLREHLVVSKGLTPEAGSILENVVSFNPPSNADSMRVARGGGFQGTKKAAYWQAGAEISDAADVQGLSALILSPARDDATLVKMDPPAGQRWLRADGERQSEDHIEPFREAMSTRSMLRKRRPRPCVLSRKEERELQTAVIASDALALTLDDALYSSSLGVLLRYRGIALLFPGDGPSSVWSTTIERSHAALWGDVILIKAGRHGGRSATPESIVAKLTHPELAAMVSTQALPFPAVPDAGALNALSVRSHGRTVRSDWVVVKGAPNAKPPTVLPKPFVPGPLWIDYLRSL